MPSIPTEIERRKYAHRIANVRGEANAYEMAGDRWTAEGLRERADEMVQDLKRWARAAEIVGTDADTLVTPTEDAHGEARGEQGFEAARDEEMEDLYYNEK